MVKPNHPYLIQPTGQNRVLEVVAANTDDGTPVMAYIQHGLENQRWEITPEGQIVTQLGNYALDIQDFGNFWLYDVVINPLDKNKKSQQWEIDEKTGVIQNKQGNGSMPLPLCIYPDSDMKGILKAGAGYPSSDTQTWKLVSITSDNGGGISLVPMNWQKLKTTQVEIPVKHPNYHYGSAVDIDGKRAVVAAGWADILGTDSGAAYIFEYEDGEWKYQQRILADDLRTQDYFGHDSAAAIDGDTVIVGARLADIPGKMANCGAAYVFDLENGQWEQTQKLQPSDLKASDEFGYSVALDGDTAIVGARYGDGPATNTGTAYIFQREKGKWTQKQRLIPSIKQANMQYGVSVAIEGKIAMVGAQIASGQGSASGVVFVYQLEDGKWVETQKLIPDDLKANDHFGVSTAISGNYAIVGADYGDAPGKADAGSAYIYKYEHGRWNLQQKLQPADLKPGDRLGYSVDISGDVALVACILGDSANNKANTGTAYIFQLKDDRWKQVEKLHPDGLNTNALFGLSVAIDKGVAALVGARQFAPSSSGTVFSFKPTEALN